MQPTMMAEARARAGLALLAFSLLGASEAFATNPPAGPHCWCRVIKSDCGACNTACTVRDFGAIAQFRRLQSNKDGLCAQACALKLGALADGDACAGLSSGLRVPLPWSGELHACASVGTGGWRAGTSRRVQCAPSATAVPQGYWKLTFADEFKGKPAGASAEVAACYDRAPKCIPFYLGGPADCPAETHGALRHLDKCTWTVLTKNNWMMADDQVNAFDAREVTVDPTLDDGVLILSARGVRPDGSLYPAPQARQVGGKWVSPKPYVRNPAPGYDCVWVSDPWNGHPLRARCSIISGAVVSQDLTASGGPRGFKQKYGKFLWRAKVPYGPGSFPALWMLPQSGPWPQAGEIDIIESYADGDYVNQGYINGLCTPGNLTNLGFDECKARGGRSFYQTVYRHQNKPPANAPAPFWASYHVFGVEWDEALVRFTVDGVVTKELKQLDLAVSTPMNEKRSFWNKLFPTTWEKQLPINVPSREFFLLMNQTVHKDGKHKYPNPESFVQQKLYVDWIRAYQRCVTPEDFCPTGGAFDGASNTCRTAQGTYRSPCSR